MVAAVAAAPAMRSAGLSDVDARCRCQAQQQQTCKAGAAFKHGHHAGSKSWNVHPTNHVMLYREQVAQPACVSCLCSHWSGPLGNLSHPCGSRVVCKAQHPLNRQPRADFTCAASLKAPCSACRTCFGFSSIGPGATTSLATVVSACKGGQGGAGVRSRCTCVQSLKLCQPGRLVYGTHCTSTQYY